MAIPTSLNSLRIPDFNGDGQTDLFSFNSATRIPEITLFAGVNRISSSSFFSIPEGWQEPKFGDFNGDRKTDLVWRNSKTGETAIWLMEGTMFSAAQSIDFLQGTWAKVVGEFDGNAKSDLFWYNISSGEFQIWIMNGLERDRVATGKIDPGWEPTIADFNHDDRTDLFWRNRTTGQNAVWTIDPQTLTVTGEMIASQPLTARYEVIDYNGDGRSDIFWRDQLLGNQIWVWSATSLQPNLVPIELPRVGGNFVIRTGDFDGDSRTDFLVRNPSTGENQLWLARDLQIQISDLAPQPAQFLPQIGDYNGDRFADIRWTSFEIQDSVVWLSDGVLSRPALK